MSQMFKGNIKVLKAGKKGRGTTAVCNGMCHMSCWFRVVEDVFHQQDRRKYAKIAVPT